MNRSLLFPAILIMAVFTPTLHADEGMWLFNAIPTKLLKERYNFTPTAKWLEHVQKSSVRFNTGGSGSFISGDGLVMTNHHVGLSTLQKMSDEKKDFVKEGYLAKTLGEEVKSTGLELNVLMSIEDVTDRVQAVVKPKMSSEEAFVARRGVMAEIEKESLDKTGLRSNVVTLYQGGQYHLYRYQRYTDVRLVFAPEQQIAFYGGDPDNFEYPRYDLDVCIFRVYEKDKPLKAEHYFKWSKAGVQDKELTFVPGNPGRTNRLATMDELHYLRDIGYPYLLQRLNRWEVLYGAWSARTDENARRAKEDFFSVQNSRKARVGGLQGLMDPELMGRKKTADDKLRAALGKDPKLKTALDAWETVAKAEKVRAANIKKATVLENGAGFNSELFGLARTLVRAAAEKPKKNGERLREFVDSNLKSLEFNLFSDEPIYDDYEILKLADGLTFLNEQLGHNDPLVKKVMAGKSPHDRAVELVTKTKLKDVEPRKKLYEGGQKAIDASEDPMILLAKLVDPESRAVRKIFETEVDEPKRQAYAQIANAKFALEGASTYPDATFTLRLAFGVVKGYEEDGKKIPYATDFAGMYEWAKLHHNKPPFDLPERWIKAKDKLDLKTALNFVCTADIIGGNSGSPVINKDAEIVGLIFDGNIQSLVLDFIYTEDQARALAVASQGIIEAMRKVYGADKLADEIVSGARKQ